MLLGAAAFAHAQQFKPFASFQIIETEFFDIIFPRESEPTARRLATFADDVYRDMSGQLGIGIPLRLPVVITPHTDLFNGYYSMTPLPRIMLFDTPPSIEWTSFPDGLKGLFIHELAHAISLNTRLGASVWMRRIFGSLVTPAMATAPYFMVEGVTVYMESASGFGRANDPLARQLLRQAIHEGKFLTPLQASNLIDISNQRHSFYEYGGLFSKWLVDNYGMEKYALLWQAMGGGGFFSFFVYSSGFYAIFRQVYGVGFLQEWEAFRDSLALDGIEENPGAVYSRGRPVPANRNLSIAALASDGDKVFILDSGENRVRVFDAESESVRSFGTSLYMPYDIGVSPDGKTALISGYSMNGDRFSAAAREHRADTGRGTGRSVQGLYRARYFRDGVIGIRSDLHNTVLVFEDFNGNSEVLLRGNDSLTFSGPQTLDDRRIAFVAARDGARELLVYYYDTGELFRVEIDGDDDNADRLRDAWRHMRGLGVSDGALFFSHNADDRMFKLASVSLDTMRATFSERDFSGGVFHPVIARGAIFYRAEFSAEDGFLRFPESPDSLSGIQGAVRLVAVDARDYGRTDVPAPAQGLPAMEASPGADFPARRYVALKYMHPFQAWLPLPLFRLDDDNFSFDGFGLISLMTEPTGRNMADAIIYADLKYLMARVDAFSWQNTGAGFPLTLGFSDTADAASANSRPFRQTRVSLEGSLARSVGRGLFAPSLGVSYLRVADFDGEKSAYEWDERGIAFSYSAGLALSSLRRRPNEVFGRGLSLSLRGSNMFYTTLHDNSFKPRLEGLFRASAQTQLPLRLSLYGAYDAGGMDLQGSSLTYGAPLFSSVASWEYLSQGFYFSWLAGAEAALGLFSVEIQGNLSHAYFNRVVGSLALKNVLYDGGGVAGPEGIPLPGGLRLAQSLALNLALVTSFLPLKISPLFIEPYVSGAWRFSNTITGEGKRWSIDAGVNWRL